MFIKVPYFHENFPALKIFWLQTYVNDGDCVEKLMVHKIRIETGFDLNLTDTFSFK